MVLIISILFAFIALIMVIYNKKDLENFKYYIYELNGNEVKMALIATNKRKATKVIEYYEGKSNHISLDNIDLLDIHNRAKIIDTINKEIVYVRYCFHCENGEKFYRGYTSLKIHIRYLQLLIKRISTPDSASL